MTDVAHVLSLLAVAHLLSVMTPGANTSVFSGLSASAPFGVCLSR